MGKFLIEDLIKTRGAAHGDFSKNAEIAASIAKIIIQGASVLTPIQYIALLNIGFKIARIIAGNPNAQEHWEDIIGYATLVRNQLEEPK